MSANSRGFIRRTGFASSVFAVAVITAFAVFGTRAEARAEAPTETLCGNHSEIATTLGARYAEAPVGMGLARNGGMVELFAAGDGATWTMVVTTPDGRSCLVAEGESWQDVAPLVPGLEI